MSTFPEKLSSTLDDILAECDRLRATNADLLQACKVANIILLQQKSYSQTDQDAMEVLQLAIAKAKAEEKQS